MKKSELRKIIKEEIQSILAESVIKEAPDQNLRAKKKFLSAHDDPKNYQRKKPQYTTMYKMLKARGLNSDDMSIAWDKANKSTRELMFGFVVEGTVNEAKEPKKGDKAIMYPSNLQGKPQKDKKGVYKIHRIHTMKMGGLPGMDFVQFGPDDGSNRIPHSISVDEFMEMIKKKEFKYV